MSDLHTIANASELRQALQTGSLDRVEISPVDLPPLEVGTVRMNSVKMTGTKLVGLAIQHLHATRVQARGILLRATRFEGAELHNWDVSASHAQEIQWPCVRMHDCRFTETPLTNANLSRSMIVGGEFAQSDLNHANLSESLLLHTNFSDSRQGGAVLDNANLSDAVLCQVNLRGANLLRASFAGAVLIGVDLRDANLVGVSFRNAVLVDCKTERAEITGQTIQDMAQAGHTLADVFERLRHLPAEHNAMIAAAMLMRGGATQATQNTQQSASLAPADPLARILSLNFANLLRELQGRGGPAELGLLRVDGDHVYARSSTGDEVRLTTAANAAPRQAPQMRVPDVAPAAPARAAPVRPPAPSGGAGGLEID